jgi:hypothetical protein
MTALESLKSRIGRLSEELKEPGLGAWPPEHGSFDHCLWQDIGQPVEHMGFMEMYIMKAAQVWGKADIV